MASSDKCAGCSFCCTILGVVELKKPAGTDCRFCTGTSCTIHDDPKLYPTTCGDFECGYVVNDMPPEYRPDRCKIMITGEDDELQTHVLHVDPRHPYAPHTILGLELIGILRKFGRFPNILVVTGDKENIVSRNPESERVLREKIARIEAEAQNE